MEEVLQILDKICGDIICTIQDQEVPNINEYALMELRNFIKDEKIVEALYNYIMGCI